MSHAMIHTGSGTYCRNCDKSWDQGEQVDFVCDPATNDVFSDVTPKIVAFAGRKGSGKDTAAEVFVKAGYTQVRMADGLKAMLRALLAYRGVSPAMIERYIEGDLKEVPCPALNGRTMRYAMQHLGTRFGRETIHPDIWVDATADRIAQCDKVVCSDVRFPNEAAMIAAKGGKTYFIDRDGTATDDHVSEGYFDDMTFDGQINNDAATATTFQGQVRKLFNLSR